MCWPEVHVLRQAASVNVHAAKKRYASVADLKFSASQGAKASPSCIHRNETKRIDSLIKQQVSLALTTNNALDCVAAHQSMVRKIAGGTLSIKILTQQKES